MSNHLNILTRDGAVAASAPGFRTAREARTARLVSDAAPQRRGNEIDRLPRALDELYPLPSRVPDELRSLIDAVVDATRRRSSP